MAERICAKFTGKTCLVPRSDEFECQVSTSKVKGHEGQKMRSALPSPPSSDGMECARCKCRHAAAAGTIPSLRGGGWFWWLVCCLCFI